MTKRKCFHCVRGKCDCMCCGAESSKGWVSGPCGFCRSRAEQLDMWTYYFERGHELDPRDRNLWIYHRPADGNKGWKEFLPLSYFRQKRKEGKA